MFEPKSLVLCVPKFYVYVCVCVHLKVQITTKSYDGLVAPVSAGLDVRQGRDGGREEGEMEGERVISGSPSCACRS